MMMCVRVVCVCGWGVELQEAAGLVGNNMIYWSELQYKLGLQLRLTAPNSHVYRTVRKEAQQLDYFKRNSHMYRTYHTLTTVS